MEVKLFPQIFCLLFFSPMIAGDLAASIKNVTIQELQRNIHESRNQRFCVLYKSEYGNTQLEKHFATFCQKLKPGNEYATWNYGKFAVDKYLQLPKSSQMIAVKAEIPHISCYIGYHVYDYSYKNHTSVKTIRHWFDQLVHTISTQHHFVEATLTNMEYYVKSYVIAIVGFASAQIHLELENLLGNTLDGWKEYIRISFLFAHHNTEDSVKLLKQLGIRDTPTIAFLKKKKSSHEEFDVLKVLKIHELDQKNIDMFLLLKCVPAVKLDTDSLRELIHSDNSSLPPCTLILLHTSSASQSQPALSLYWRTITFLRDKHLHMQFAMMEVNHHTINIVYSVFPTLVSMQLPATALLCKQQEEEFKKVIIPGRPSMSNVVPTLEEHSALLSISGKKRKLTLPWGQADPNKVSLVTEGPHGHLCTPHSHNETISNPCYKEDHQKSLPVPQVKIPFGSWHDRYDTGSLESQLEHVGNLPLLNRDMWYEIIDKSHAPKHPFYPGEQKWSGEVTKTSLVIFIQGGCGNCVRKMSEFEDVRKSIQFVDGGAVYLVNCSLDYDLCEENKIRGFPTLVAYRGLGWMEADHCTELDPRLQPQHVEIEYHGVLQEKYIMAWFGKIAGKAVTNMRSDPLPEPTLSEPVQLVANLVPRSSRYMHTATHRVVEAFYPYECFRLACERLYSQITCMARYHPKVPSKEFTDQEDLVVTQVLIIRADGFWATIMSAGQPLPETLRAEEMTNVDKFHKPHNYKFPSKRQKCEEDPGFCTDLIADFTKDHGRLPITHMTAEHFHIRESFIFHNNLPLIVALVYKENITENASFYQVLQTVAAELYSDMVLITVDVREYISWSRRFIPKSIIIGLGDDIPTVYIYPRLCVVYWTDHNHAAFYPPLHISYTQDDPFRYNAADVIKFMREFLKDPDSLLVQTEHF